MELFWRLEVRPHRPPGLDERSEIVGSPLVACGVSRRKHPWLRAFDEQMRDRSQAFRIVEGAGAKVDDFLAPGTVAIEPAPAIAAEPGYDGDAGRRGVAPWLRHTLQNVKILGPDRHVQRERAAGGGLTIGAMAGVEQQRKRRDLVTNRAARTAAGHRKRGSRGAHDHPHRRLGWKDYPENLRAATPSLFWHPGNSDLHRFSITRLWMARPK